MKLRPALLLITTLAALLPAAPPALACSFVPPRQHTLLETEQGVDTQPPAALQSASASVSRGVAPESDGCGGLSISSCDSIGSIRLSFAGASDDRTPPDQLGYLIVLASGSLPDGFYLPAEDGEPTPLRADAGGGLSLHWSDGATDDQEAIDFTVEIFPMDLAGNVGDPISVRVHDEPEDLACSVAPRRGAPTNALTWGALGLGLLAAARRW